MIDTQLHLLDPRCPFAPGGYRPAAHEMGDLATLLAMMEANAITHGVLVQPSAYGTDNTALLDALAAHPDRFRAVVMTDDPARAAAPGVKGVRLNLTDYAPHASGALEMARRVLGEGLILQVQAAPMDLARLLGAAPDGPVVIDHMGRPDSAADGRALAALAARPQTWLKVSGGFRLPGGWPQPSPWLADLAASFGPDGLLWGSDWPFLNTPRRPTTADTVAWGAALTDMAAATVTARRLFGFPP
ncbi:MAG: amidohydrolase family protein [Pseudomonadota bacterium]